MIRHVLGYCIALITGIMLHTTINAQSTVTLLCYPDNSSYTTGTVTSSQKIDTIIYAAGGGSRGFMKFNISAIPDGSVITEVKLHYYIMNSNYPYYRFTKIAADPVTTAAPNLYSLIGQATANNSPATYYTYSAPQQNGQVQAVLNSYAKNDLTAALSQDWFAIGLYEYDPSTYYLQVAGRNMSTRPYLTVSYMPSLQNDAGLTQFTYPPTQLTPGNYPVKVQLKNFGTNYINSAIINWTMDGVAQPAFAFQDTLSPNNTRIITLGNKNFTVGTHVLTATVSSPNGQTDPYPANNSITQTWYAYVPPVFFELDSTIACPGDTVTIPVYTQGFNQVNDLHLQITYDPTELTFLSWQNVHPNLENFSISGSSGIVMTAQSINPMSIPDDDILTELRFVFLGEDADLRWDTTGNFNYALNSTGSPYPVNLRDGAVMNADVRNITQPPQVKTAAAGSTVYLSAWALSYGPVQYQWQASTDGGTTWGNLFNSNQYQGVNSGFLYLYSIPYYYNGMKYRCIFSTNCGDTSSNVTTLLVNSLPVYCHLDSIYSCNADTIQVPVQVQYFSSVSGFNLHLQVDTTQLLFVNWGGLNAQLGNPAGFQASMNGNILNLSWTNTALAGFDWNTLVYLNFIPVGSGCQYSLNWVDSGPGASVFYGLNGTALTSSFSDGYVCHTLPPAAPGPITGSSVICNSAIYTYAVSSVPGAYSYMWEVPVGANIIGGWATTAISVQFSAQAISGVIRVSAVNGCGSGPATELPVTIYSVPGPAGYIYGPTQVCPGSSPVTFACALIPGATAYSWVLPYGLVAQSTYNNSIVVTVQSGFAGGIIQVFGYNNCGAGQVASMYVAACAFPPDSLTCVLPELSACEGLLHYPVIIRNGYDIASISLGIQFDPDHLSYAAYSNPHPGLASGFLMVNSTASTVQIGWFSVSPIDLEDDTLLFLDFMADTGYSMLSFDLQTIGSCYFTDLNNTELNAWYVSGYVYAGICASLTGILTYDNPASTPLTNTEVNLGNWYAAQSGTDGGFEFPSVGSGTWLLHAAVSKPAGGVNATDALKVLNHFVNTQPLSGLKLQAADVDGTGFVNAADGLMIAKRFVGMITTFPTGDWLSEEKVVSIAGSGSFTEDLKAICYGDLDGSFVPAIKQQSAVEISANGLGIETRNKTFRLPLLSTREAEAGAVSLVIALPSDQYRLISVEGPDHGQLLWHQSGTEIRIAWFDAVPMRLSTGDALLVLNFSSGDTDPVDGERFEIQAISGSTIANSRAEEFTHFALVYPDRFEGIDGFVQVHPNPVTGSCRIDYRLSEAGNHYLSIFNSTGQEVWRKDLSAEAAGIQRLSADLSVLSPGAYVLVLEDGGQVKRSRLIKE